MKRYVFETSRLLFREFTMADARLLWELDGDPAVMRHISKGRPTSLESICGEILPRWLRYYQLYQGLGYWAMHQRERGEFMGWIHLKPYLNRVDTLELGYRLHRRFWGSGYATEATRAWVDRAFERPETQCVVGTTLIANFASRRVLQRAGLSKESNFLYETSLLPGWSEEERRAVRYTLDRPRYERRLARALELRLASEMAAQAGR
ncbi:MAG: GNAT family N-acetyltransferase [Candidatus Hydrogenedentes bacterium]|nr:GNAT family N-acetyltransferase [Candidatus Hydrogenedentota bacterium]